MPSGSPVAGQRGFTYMGLLLFIAIAGIALAVIGPVWHTEAQREREKELLFVGEQYARAIGSYYESTPGGVKQYPASLRDLLEDSRLPVVRRHLRKLYPDPITGSREWGLLKVQGRITGVYSLSRDRPLKTNGFEPPWDSFSSAENYDAWQFVYAPGNKLLAQQSSAADQAQGVTTESDGVAPLPGNSLVPLAPSPALGHQGRNSGRWR